MAAQKQASAEQITGQKRSKNKFKKGPSNVIVQGPGHAAEFHAQVKGNSAGGAPRLSESVAAAAQSQTRSQKASMVGAAALVNGAGSAAGPNAGRKRSRNKFKQHSEQPTAATVEVTRTAATTTAAPSHVADAAPASAGENGAKAKRRSKNKFKPQAAAQPPAQEPAGGVTLSAAAPPDSSGGSLQRPRPPAAVTGEEAGDKATARQHPAGTSGRLPVGVPPRAPGLGSPAGKRSGQPGQRGGHKPEKAAAAGKLAGQKRGPGDAGLPEHAAAGAKRKKRRRKAKGGAATTEEGVASVAGKSDVKAPVTPTVLAPPPKGALLCLFVVL